MTTEQRPVVYLVLREPPPPLKKKKEKKRKPQSDGMKWNGQGVTAYSNEIHYVGVKEVSNNKAWTASRTSPLQHLPRNQGSKDMHAQRERETETEREGEGDREGEPFLVTSA